MGAAVVMRTCDPVRTAGTVHEEANGIPRIGLGGQVISVSIIAAGRVDINAEIPDIDGLMNPI